MTSFAHDVSSWETFYLLAGTAAATLVGLLFVAVSINIDSFRQNAYGDLQLYAALTFNCFFYVLLISLLFLVPGISPLGLGLPLFVLGALGLANVLIQRRKAQRIQSERNARGIAARFVAPSLCLLGLALVGILTIAQVAEGLYGLVVIIVVLLAVAALNAWSLLLRVEEAEEAEAGAAGNREDDG